MLCKDKNDAEMMKKIRINHEAKKLCLVDQLHTTHGLIWLIQY